MAAKDNIFRGIVSAIIQGVVILLIATAMTNIHDIMAVQSGYIYAEGISHTSALVMGQELLPDLLYKIFVSSVKISFVFSSVNSLARDCPPT